MSTFVKQYIGAFIGLVFGAVVATLTTMAIYGDLPVNDAEVLQKCLIEVSRAKR